MTDVGVFFDLDKTILSTSSSIALQKPFIKNGITSRIKTFLTLMSQLEYLLFGAGHEKTQKMKERIANLSIGINVKELEKVTELSCSEYIEPKCYSKIVDLIQTHKAAEHNTVLASASSEQVVRPISKYLNIDYYLGTELEIVDDEFTGKINTFLYADEKAKAVKNLAEEKGWDLEKSYAYSDSITDLPLLELVGNPVVVNPDKELKEIAIQRNWKIITTKEKIDQPNTKIKLTYIVLITLLTTSGFLVAKNRYKN